MSHTDGEDGRRDNQPEIRNSRSASTQYFDCGPIIGLAAVDPGTGTCHTVQTACGLGRFEGERNLLRPTTTQAVVTTLANGQQQTTINCEVPVAKPQVTAAMATAEARRLLPHPTIGTAPRGHATLVNIETVLWIDTAVERDLGTVTLLGHRLALRARIVATRWDFGDGETGYATGPGRAYTSADPCRTADCPSYYGHMYRRTGRVDITAELTWTGQFRVDDGNWQDIEGTVNAAATTNTVTVKQARGILVPNPDH